LLSAVLDYLSTYLLFYLSVFSGATTFEANPLASRVLDVSGETGMLAYRLAIAVITISGSEWIARHGRIATARALLLGGACVNGGVAIHNLYLLTIAT
jgi:hypothetical protein